MSLWRVLADLCKDVGKIIYFVLSIPFGPVFSVVAPEHRRWVRKAIGDTYHWYTAGVLTQHYVASAYDVTYCGRPAIGRTSSAPVRTRIGLTCPTCMIREADAREEAP